MTQQQQQQQQQYQQPLVFDAAKVAQLDQRVGALEEGIERILTKLDAKSAINWAPITILVTVLGMIGSAGFAWINSGQSRLEAVVIQQREEMSARIERVAATQVGRAEHQLEWKHRDQLFDLQRDRMGQIEARTEKRLDRLEAMVRPSKD